MDKLHLIAKQNQITVKQLIALVEPVLYDTLDKTMDDIENWIKRFVPKRTGQLRDSLLANMASSRVKKGVLRFIIGTHLNYAAKVNRMTTKQVRHDSGREHRQRGPKRRGKKGRYKKGKLKKARWAYAYYYGHYGRIYLHDPQAIGGFWFKLLTYLRTRILFHMANAMRFQYGKTKLPWVIS